MQSIRDICSLTLGTGKSAWSTLCPEITRIASEQSRVTDPRYKLPSGLLSAFVLSALDVDDRFSVQVDALRRKEASGVDISVEDIVAKINLRSAQLATAANNTITGNVAGVQNHQNVDDDVVVPHGLRKGQCFNWHGPTGKYRFGDTCRFRHGEQDKCDKPNNHRGRDRPRPTRPPSEAPRQGCYECGFSDHSFSKCDVAKDRKARQAEAEAKMDAKLAKIDALTVSFEGRLKGMRAHVSADPYGSHGEFGTLFVPPAAPVYKDGDKTGEH